MPRRRRPIKREVLPDPKFGSVLMTKFINCMMFEGKKGVSETIFYKAMDILEQRAKKDPVEVFMQALENVKPSLRSSREGSAAPRTRSRLKFDRNGAGVVSAGL